MFADLVELVTVAPLIARYVVAYLCETARMAKDVVDAPVDRFIQRIYGKDS